MRHLPGGKFSKSVIFIGPSWPDVWPSLTLRLRITNARTTRTPVSVPSAGTKRTLSPRATRVSECVCAIDRTNAIEANRVVRLASLFSWATQRNSAVDSEKRPAVSGPNLIPKGQEFYSHQIYFRTVRPGGGVCEMRLCRRAFARFSACICVLGPSHTRAVERFTVMLNAIVKEVFRMSSTGNDRQL
uniref:Uncharacterized protein n=1 Tax=Schistocephalus solidus TaxID=70667 RepID=A0A0X3PIY3_SCHSO